MKQLLLTIFVTSYCFLGWSRECKEEVFRSSLMTQKQFSELHQAVRRTLKDCGSNCLTIYIEGPTAKMGALAKLIIPFNVISLPFPDFRSNPMADFANAQPSFGTWPDGAWNGLNTRRFAPMTDEQRRRLYQIFDQLVLPHVQPSTRTLRVVSIETTGVTAFHLQYHLHQYLREVLPQFLIWHESKIIASNKVLVERMAQHFNVPSVEVLQKEIPTSAVATQSESGYYREYGQFQLAGLRTNETPNRREMIARLQQLLSRFLENP